MWGYHRTAGWSRPATRPPTWCRCRPPRTALAAFAERAAAQRRAGAPRSSVRSEAVGPLWERPRAALVGPREIRWRPAAPADRQRARGRARPAGAAHRAGRPRRALPGLRGDVHRGGRHLARSSAAARTSTGPGSRSSSAEGLVVRPDRGRPGGVQGRGGVPPRRTPARSRACTSTRRAAARVWPPPGWPPWCELALREIAPVVSLYVNEHNARPAGPTPGPASSRPGPSPRSCSDGPDLSHNASIRLLPSSPAVARVGRCSHSGASAISEEQS